MYRYLIIVIPIIALLGFVFKNTMDPNPWTTKETISPENLSSIIKDNDHLNDPFILNIGPSGAIKGSTKIGSVDNAKGVKLLTNRLKNLPKDKMLVVYCGCCPYEHCPNIRPAFTILQKQGFTNKRLLDLPVNLKVDWIDKGFPMQ